MGASMLGESTCTYRYYMGIPVLFGAWSSWSAIVACSVRRVTCLRYTRLLLRRHRWIRCTHVTWRICRTVIRLAQNMLHGQLSHLYCTGAQASSGRWAITRVRDDDDTCIRARRRSVRIHRPVARDSQRANRLYRPTHPIVMDISNIIYFIGTPSYTRLCPYRLPIYNIQIVLFIVWIFRIQQQSSSWNYIIWLVYSYGHILMYR